MTAVPWRAERAHDAQFFYFAPWVVALYLVGAPLIGGSVGILMWLAVTEPQRAGAAGVVFVIVLGLIFLPLAAGCLWYVIAAIRRRPQLRIDARGVVWGGDWDRDLAVEWKNVRNLRVRTATANGISDTQIVVDVLDERPIRARARGFRQRGTLMGNGLYFGAPLGISTVYFRGGYNGVIAAVRRHYRGPIEAS